MAWENQDEQSGPFRIGFRFNGKQHRRSLKTADYREAEAIRSRVDETIRLIKRGRLEIPPDVDPAVFILSDGKRGNETKGDELLTLEGLFARRLSTSLVLVTRLMSSSLHSLGDIEGR